MFKLSKDDGSEIVDELISKFKGGVSTTFLMQECHI